MENLGFLISLDGSPVLLKEFHVAYDNGQLAITDNSTKDNKEEMSGQCLASQNTMVAECELKIDFLRKTIAFEASEKKREEWAAELEQSEADLIELRDSEKTFFMYTQSDISVTCKLAPFVWSKVVFFKTPVMFIPKAQAIEVIQEDVDCVESRKCALLKPEPLTFCLLVTNQAVEKLMQQPVLSSYKNALSKLSCAIDVFRLVGSNGNLAVIAVDKSLWIWSNEKWVLHPAKDVRHVAWFDDRLIIATSTCVFAMVDDRQTVICGFYHSELAVCGQYLYVIGSQSLCIISNKLTRVLTRMYDGQYPYSMHASDSHVYCFTPGGFYWMLNENGLQRSEIGNAWGLHITGSTLRKGNELFFFAKDRFPVMTGAHANQVDMTTGYVFDFATHKFTVCSTAYLG